MQWQITSKPQKLRFIKLDQNTLQLVIFTDSSFANNRDMSLQINYIIRLTNATNKAKIIHRSLIKYKWVIYSVLAAELYGIVREFYIETVIKIILEKMLESVILLILYTDSKSLYNCLIKLETI